MTEPSMTTEFKGAASINPSLPNIPTMLRAEVPGAASALSDVQIVSPSTPITRLPAEPLRFVQRGGENRPMTIASAVEPERDDRTCALPQGLTFKGEAHYPCDVRIDGMVLGNVTAEPNRTITISREGKIKGSLKATNVRIDGEADGEITATGGLASFGANSVCKGQIAYGRLMIAEGADVEASMKKLAAA